MGKTSLLAKLADELTAAGRSVIRLSAETSNLDVLAQRVMRQLRENKLVNHRIERWERELRGEASLSILGTGIKLIGSGKRGPQHGQELDLIDLLAGVDNPVGTVLIIDEITVLCSALGSDAAMEFLGNLRAERQTGRPIPLVLSGSIGLHHAIPDTKVINDLWTVEVGPLAPVESRELVDRLLLGIEMASTPALVADILSETSGISFYVQAVVDRLRYHPATPVCDIVERCIIENIWHTEHYVSRLVDYYDDRAALVAIIVDEFALAREPLTLDALQARISTRSTQPLSRDELVDMLQRLEKDHYLTRTGLANRMSSSLLAKIWRIHRRLE